MPTPTRSPEATSGSSSALLPRRKPSLFKSPYALANTPDGSLGSFGGVLLKPWMPRAGGWNEGGIDGNPLPPGTFVPSWVTSAWPLQNRLAMHKNGFVQFFETAREAELATGHAPQVTAAIQANPARAVANAADARRASLARARAAKAAKRLEALGLSNLLPGAGESVTPAAAAAGA